MARAQTLQPVYQKKRELEAEVAALAVSRDTAKQQAAEAVEAVGALEERRKGIAGLIDGLVATAKEALAILSATVAQAASVQKTASDAVSEAKTALRSLELRIEQEGIVLAQIRDEQKARLAEIARENDKLGVRERDIDVMRVRIIRRAEELGIPANI